MQHWRYLTGKDEAVTAVSDALGFHYRADVSAQKFAHPAGVVFVTSDGVISSYLLGLGYRAKDIQHAVAIAARGEVAFPVTPVLLLCYDFDPVTGKRTLAIVKILRLIAAMTVSVTAGALILAFHPKRSHP